MATLAADKPRVFDAGFDEHQAEVPMIAADILYAGAAAGELNDSGTVQPLGTGSTVDKFAGFVTAKADNSAGAASAITAKLRTRGRVTLSVTGVTSAADLGKTVYASDDDTFTLTIGTMSIGNIVRWITGTTCVVEFTAFHLRASVPITHDAETVDLATDRSFFIATRPWYVKAINQIHSVAAGGTSTLDVTKDTGTTAPGAGTVMTTAAFDLNATANTVQTGALATTAGLRKLAAGDRLARNNNHAIQSTAGVKIGVELIPL